MKKRIYYSKEDFKKNKNDYDLVFIDEYLE